MGRAPAAQGIVHWCAQYTGPQARPGAAASRKICTAHPSNCVVVTARGAMLHTARTPPAAAARAAGGPRARARSAAHPAKRRPAPRPSAALFHRPPPPAALEVAAELLASGDPSVHGYGPAEGLPALREALRDKVRRDNGLEGVRSGIFHVSA